MLGFGEILAIQALFKRNGGNISAIARALKLDRGTVARALKRDFSRPKPSRTPSLDRFDRRIEELLLLGEKERQAFKKNRLKGPKIAEILSSEGCHLSLRAIQYRVAAAKARLAARHDLGKDVALALDSPQGCAQVDFGQVFAKIGGKSTRLNLLICSLPYSNAARAICMPSQDSASLFEGLAELFRQLGGTPARIRFDNMSTAVSKISRPKRKLTEDFERFALHYGFESEFCNPNLGQEKGHVEGKVEYIRRRFFVPMPEFESLEDLNKGLAAWCSKDMARDHYKKRLSILALFEREKSAFLPLPKKTFIYFDQRKTQTDKQGYACYKGSYYFAGKKCACLPVIVQASAFKVKILSIQGDLLASYDRSYEPSRRLQPASALAQVLSFKLSALPYIAGASQQAASLAQELRGLRIQERADRIMDFLTAHPPEHISLEGKICMPADDFKPNLAKYDEFMAAAS